MNAILLSIKPAYVEKILNGTKKYEYRKRLPRKDIDIIYIYSTYPEKKVVGTVKITSCLSAPPSVLWEKTKSNAGISRLKYREYFKGCKKAYAYELGAVNVFDEAKQLSDYGINVAPQSFMYIK